MSPTKKPSEDSLATDNSQKAPIIATKELRKILGQDAKGLDDDTLRNVSIGLGKLALLLTENPELFNNFTEGEK